MWDVGNKGHESDELDAIKCGLNGVLSSWIKFVSDEVVLSPWCAAACLFV